MEAPTQISKEGLGRPCIARPGSLKASPERVMHEIVRVMMNLQWKS
jgi:hypothetical protein